MEERGSAYLPQVNAFYVREFQMMHAAEDATRFLHHACQGLARPPEWGKRQTALKRVLLRRAMSSMRASIEHAVAYFGSRVLHPSRPAPEERRARALLSRAALREGRDRPPPAGMRDRFESAAQEWGYRIGSQIYDLYLAGKVKQSGLRRLFLAQLGEPGQARRVCIAVIAKIRAASR